MDGIAKLEQRISAALDRIGAGVDRHLAAPSAPSAAQMTEVATLRAELDEERSANAQMAERLKVQRERSEKALADMAAEVDRLTRQVDEQALAMQRLTTSSIQMREDLRRMRDAEAVDPALIDKTMAAELEALRATRAAEAAELADIVSALTPIVEAEEARAHA